MAAKKTNLSSLFGKLRISQKPAGMHKGVAALWDVVEAEDTAYYAYLSAVDKRARVYAVLLRDAVEIPPEVCAPLSVVMTRSDVLHITPKRGAVESAMRARVKQTAAAVTGMTTTLPVGV